MKSLTLVNGYIEEGTLPEALAELRETESRIETIWGEYLKLSERRDALRTRCAELTDRMARAQIVAPKAIPDSLQPRAPRIGECLSCGKPTREHFTGLTYCKRCSNEIAFAEAMERAEGGAGG